MIAGRYSLHSIGVASCGTFTSRLHAIMSAGVGGGLHHPHPGGDGDLVVVEGRVGVQLIL